jgi:hypothetical protein
MTSERRYRSVPLHRRWINDIIHFGKKSQVMGVTWRINVAPLVAARAGRQPAIGWAAIWMKALALVGRRRPELRTAYLPFPWARLYVHPECICSIVIDRTWNGASALFFEQIARTATQPLAVLDANLRNLKQVPVESVGSFRRLIRFAKPPVIVRRTLWSMMLYWSGPLRTKYIGTYALNPFPTGGTVTQSAMPISFVFYFGLVEPNGDMQIQVFYDHRITDGIEVYRMLRDVEATMNRDIVAELGQAAGGSESPPLVADIEQ